jgi:hypothetical protein
MVFLLDFKNGFIADLVEKAHEPAKGVSEAIVNLKIGGNPWGNRFSDLRHDRPVQLPQKGQDEPFWEGKRPCERQAE